MDAHQTHPTQAERVEATRAAIRTLPNRSDITADDLRSVGVTEEQSAELVDADDLASFWQYHAERESAREFDLEYGLNREDDDCYGL